MNRWLILLFVICSVVTAYFLKIQPLQPFVSLPAENLSDTLFVFAGQEFHFTNTMLALLISDAILLLIAFGVYRAAKSGSLVPKGLSGAVEALLEALYNMTEGTAGKWAKNIFPWFVSITLLVLIANWMELIPGVDSIGLFNPHHVHGFEEICNQSSVGPFVAVSSGGTAEGKDCAEAVVPFVRVVSTDLNFTVALALIAVFMVQVIGVRAQGSSYFTKFWNTKTVFSKPIFGVIDFLVGLLELVSDFSKVLSFAFRLFGNIFAGSVLLFVIGSLVPVFAQSIFLMLEFFVGAIQAIVFGLLTMTFMAQATQGHGEHEEVHA